MAKEAEPVQKIGDGHLAAFGRQGLRELRAVMYPSSNVAQAPEYGLYGTMTPGEIADACRPDERDLDEEPKSIVTDRQTAAARQAESDRTRDDRDPERA